MRLLIVTYRFPVYPGDAPSTTVFNLARYFSRNHRVSLVGLAPRPGPRERVEELAGYCQRMEAIPWPKWRGVLSTARGFFSPEPLQMLYYRSALLTGAVRRIIAEERIDIALGYHLRAGQFLAGVDSIPKVLAIQPAQALHFGRRYQLTHNPILRVAYGMEHRRLSGYEANLAEKFESCLLISNKDRDAIDPAHRLRNVFLNPHGTDVDALAPPAGTVREASTLVFCGSMYMDTNSSAALYFHRAILPLIWRERPEVRLLIVGKNPPRSVAKLGEDRRITVTGTVPDIRPYLWRASVGIDPVRMAAGMQNKLIEGLAAGLPMVISPEANEGIHAPEGSALLVGRTPEEFASQVIRLLNHPQQAQAIATAGLEFVRAQWSWEHHFRCLEQKLEGILAERIRASA
jgi:hypothetical protein